MDKTETIVKNYLIHNKHTNIKYEPDGNIPPDFVINKKIAIEVRGLNQQIIQNNKKPKGIEEDSIPLFQRMNKIFDFIGSPIDNTSWGVIYRYSRPIPKWKTLKKDITTYLEDFQNKRVTDKLRNITGNFSIELVKSSNNYNNFFILYGIVDQDQGGWIVNEIAKSMKICIDEKWQKISKVINKYPTWWLILVDFISGGLTNFDKDQFERDYKIKHNFNKVILINPGDFNAEIEL